MNSVLDGRMRIDELRTHILSLSLQELHNSLPAIIDSIFYADPGSYWDIVSRAANREDKEKIIDFLSPDGQLFEIVTKFLSPDKIAGNGYEFPISRLSAITQASLPQSASAFIGSRLVIKTHGIATTTLSLNAFEYFMFSLVGCICRPDIAERIEWANLNENVYCTLIFRYFDMFFFRSQASSCLMALAVQQRGRTPFSQSSFCRSPNASLNASIYPIHEYSLLSSHRHRSSTGRTTLSTSMRQTPSTADVPELYFTDVFVQSVAELWLAGPLDTSNVPVTSGRASTSMVVGRPSESLVCLVRSFVKHIYHFCFARSITVLSLASQQECEYFGKLNLYRMQLLPKFVVPRIAIYLHALFSCWPIDLSFKIVMETWLSAMQPWRYVDTPTHAPNASSDMLVDNSSSNDDWETFVVTNEILYGPLLLLFARRLRRMDLAVSRNAYMLLRVARTLKQLPIASAAVRRAADRPRDPLWSDIRSTLALALTDIDQVLVRIEADDRPTDKSTGFFMNLWAGLAGSDNDSTPQRLRTALMQSREMFCQLLDVPEQEDSEMTDGNRDDYGSQPEYVETARGSQLTSFGRFQVANGLCRLSKVGVPVDYYGRPVCSYEFGPVVKAAARMSSAICKRYSSQIRSACSRDDLWGRVVRYILVGRPLPRNNTCSINEFIDSNPPRLPLRFLASQAFLFWFLMAYAIGYCAFDFGIANIVIFMIIGYALFAMTVVVCTGFH